MCILWYFANALFLQNPLNPSSMLKIYILKVFGARIGRGVVLKQFINVKYPWNLTIGNNVWVGEKVWLDSLGIISIGDNVVVSQGAYLCTGSHDLSDPSFGLVVKPIEIEDGAWICAQAIILLGVIVASHSVVTAGSILKDNTQPYKIYEGNPAKFVRDRVLN